MKKKIKIALASLLLLSIVIFPIYKLWSNGAFIFTRSAEISSNRVVWNEKEYSPAFDCAYTEGKTLARGKDGDWKINAVKEDQSHTFVVARTFLDQYLFVADDYMIPTEGRITTISWHGAYITDKAFIDAIGHIEAEKTTSFSYETDAIYRPTDTQCMRELYFAYEYCPVTTEFKGYMGKVNGEWVITTQISDDIFNEDGSPRQYSVSCYRIPEQYWDILSEYFR